MTAFALAVKRQPVKHKFKTQNRFGGQSLPKRFFAASVSCDMLDT
jgi:hypothetical protein